MQSQLLDGRYEIEKVLGAGGFGQTFIAKDRKMFDAICVVKLLKPAANDAQTLELARRMFAAEARLLHELGNHDRIPRLFASFEAEQNFYLVQEYVEGHPLSEELIPNAQLPEADVIQLVDDILEPLAFVHQNKIIHRDIKPPNLMRRNSDGKIVLIDFGSVKQIENQVVEPDGQTKMTVAIGTYGYMPTEQGAGTPELSSDLYAVGMIAIQALTGIMPHKLTLNSDREIDWQTNVSITPELADFINKMIRYDCRQRYQSAPEALNVIRDITGLDPDPHIDRAKWVDLKALDKKTLDELEAEAILAPDSSTSTQFVSNGEYSSTIVAPSYGQTQTNSSSNQLSNTQQIQGRQEASSSQERQTTVSQERPTQSSSNTFLIAGAIISSMLVAGGLVYFNSTTPPPQSVAKEPPSSSTISTSITSPETKEQTAIGSAPNQSIGAGTKLKIEVSNSLDDLSKRLQEVIKIESPDISLTTSNNSSQQALEAVAKGTADIAIIGRSLSITEEEKGLASEPFGRIKIAIIVKENNPYRGNLTLQEFSKIFRGEVTDWSQLASSQGAKGKIKFIDSPDNNDTRQSFRNYPVFQNGKLQTGSNTEKLTNDSTQAIIDKLGSDGIGYRPAYQIKNIQGIRSVTLHSTQPDDPKYPFSQSIIIVYKKDNPSVGLKTFLSLVNSYHYKNIFG